MESAGSVESATTRKQDNYLNPGTSNKGTGESATSSIDLLWKANVDTILFYFKLEYKKNFMHKRKSSTFKIIANMTFQT